MTNAELFQSFTRSGEGGAQIPDAKNQGYHQPIEIKLCMNESIAGARLMEIKLCMSQYSHESIADAKFESGNSSSFG